MSKNVPEPTKQEIMKERGHFTANGYTFTVEPVTLDEEDQYFSEVGCFLYPHNKDGSEVEDISDRELASFARALFLVDRKDNDSHKRGALEKIKLWLVKHFCRDYRFYSDTPTIMAGIKWIEKKVKYKGKRIRFYDLERKYGLSKVEIVKLFGYFEKMSNF